MSKPPLLSKVSLLCALRDSTTAAAAAAATTQCAAATLFQDVKSLVAFLLEESPGGDSGDRDEGKGVLVVDCTANNKKQIMSTVHNKWQVCFLMVIVVQH